MAGAHCWDSEERAGGVRERVVMRVEGRMVDVVTAWRGGWEDGEWVGEVFWECCWEFGLVSKVTTCIVDSVVVGGQFSRLGIPLKGFMQPGRQFDSIHCLSDGSPGWYRRYHQW